MHRGEFEEGFPEPVDAVKGRVYVIDRGAESAQRDLHNLRHAKFKVLLEAPLSSQHMTPVHCISEFGTALGRKHVRENHARRHELPWPEHQTDDGVSAIGGNEQRHMLDFSKVSRAGSVNRFAIALAEL